MSKLTQVMSLSVPPEMVEQLDRAATEQGYMKRSKLACELFDSFMNLNFETHESLKRSAKQRNVPVSELVEYLVDRFSLEDTTVKPVVLKIPVEVVQDREKLQNWLLQKVAVLVNHLHPAE